MSCGQQQGKRDSALENKAEGPTVLESGFVYDSAPFPECHASSIVDLQDGRLMATWFGGTEEKHKDVTIWTSTYEKGKWHPFEQVADGIQNDNERFPCWNPVLFKHSSGTLYLFYKVGPNPREWWGEFIQSEDNGESWSEAVILPDGQLGPIRAKPIELNNGNVLCPSSEEFTSGPWKVHMEEFNPDQNSWTKTNVDHDAPFNAIQPTIFRHSETSLQIMCRSRENRIVESWSTDNGKSWGKLSATSLPNPSAGIDGVTLPDGRQLLIYNPTEDGRHDRAKLNLAISSDGKEWTDIYKVEDEKTGEFSYPAMIQLPNGDIHITYTWKRKKLKHIILKLT